MPFHHHLLTQYYVKKTCINKNIANHGRKNINKIMHIPFFDKHVPRKRKHVLRLILCEGQRTYPP